MTARTVHRRDPAAGAPRAGDIADGAARPCCAAVLIATAALALAIRDAARARHVVYGMCLIASSALLVIALLALLGVSGALGRHAAARPAVARRAFPSRCALGLLPGRGQSRRRRGEPVCARLRPPRAGTAPRAAVLSGLSRRHEPRRARRRRLHVSGVVGVHVALLLGAGHGASPRAATTRAPATSI